MAIKSTISAPQPSDVLLLWNRCPASNTADMAVFRATNLVLMRWVRDNARLRKYKSYLSNIYSNSLSDCLHMCTLD